MSGIGGGFGGGIGDVLGQMLLDAAAAAETKEAPEVAPAVAPAEVAPAEAAKGPAAAGDAPLPAIALGGKALPRLAPLPTPASPAQTVALNKVRDSLITALPGFTDWRSAEAAAQALKTPPVRGRDGKEASFGDLTIIRPGGTNVTVSPAFLFRAAQHSGKVVVAYHNGSDPALNTLRPLDTFDGVPVPPELRGKIFAYGSPAPCAIAYDQCSDQFLEALEQMRKQKDVLGLDVMTSKATVMGNSEGAFDVPLTRRRLEQAGFKDTIGTAIAITGGANAGFASDDFVAVKIAGAATKLMGDALGPPNPDWKRYMDVLDPEALREVFPQEDARLVDLSMSAAIGEGAPLFGLFGGGNNVRPALRLAATVDGVNALLHRSPLKWTADDVKDVLTGGSSTSDGLLTTAMGRWGKLCVVSEKPHDHAGMIEDPSVVDEMLRALAGRRP